MTDLHIGNDARLSVTLTDSQRSPVVAGSVVATLLDSSGAPAPGMAWPLALSHEGGGVWSARLRYTLDLQRNGQYTLRVVADNGDIRESWDFPVQAKVRKG